MDGVTDEDHEPSLESDIADQRIAARRLRIQRRAEAVRREQLGDQGVGLEEMKKEMSQSRKQMEASYLRLKKLQDDGFEMVTNIRVAGDAREVERRLHDEEMKRQRKEKLDAEERTAIQRFDEITKKWESAFKKEIPQELYDMLTNQKNACDLMLDEKNKVINDYQSDLKAKDDQYVQNLKRQAEDIDLLIERMEEQAKELTKACRTELEEIERAFVAERSKMLTKYRRKWDTLIEERAVKEGEFLRTREDRVAHYESLLNAQRVQDAEDYTQLKIKLETDVQILQQQLQQMKATYQLNQEKLEYNFHVLRKRDEENAITKSQQKRKITRANDTLTSLRQKLIKQEKDYHAEGLALKAEYKRVTDQYKDMQKKSKLFMTADSKKFADIWCMNEEECKQLADRLMLADNIITEQQLGLEWQMPPDLEFMRNVGPLKSGRSAKKSVQQLMEKVVSSVDGVEAEEEEEVVVEEKSVRSKQEDLSNELLKEFSPQLIRKIVSLLCDESGFLIESKLNKLLAPLDRGERTLMKLDVIFDVMGIETEEDIRTLSTYFLRFRRNSQSARFDAQPSYSSVGVGPDHQQHTMSVITSDHKMQHLPSFEGPSYLRAQSEQEDELQYAQSEMSFVSVPSTRMAEETTNRRSQSESEEKSDGGPDSGEADDGIDANDVLKVLRAFTEDVSARRATKHKEEGLFMTMNDRDSSEDMEYWSKYPGVISEDKVVLWDALTENFDKYYQVLSQREKLIEEMGGMRQQNTELRLLLQQYIGANASQELDLAPPTTLLQHRKNGVMQ